MLDGRGRAEGSAEERAEGSAARCGKGRHRARHVRTEGEKKLPGALSVKIAGPLYRVRCLYSSA